MQAMSRSVWLTVDIGNSAVKAGLFAGDQIVKTAFANSIAEILAYIAEWNRRREIQRVGLCSVVPSLSGPFLSKIGNVTDAPIFEVSSASALPIQISYTPPESLGSDRLAAACGAWYPGGSAQIIIDAGTAITIDVVHANGVFPGGVIMPGPALSNQALSSYTAKLPEVPLVLPEGAYGNSTTKALQHGLIHGMIDGVLGAIRRIQCSLGTPSPITLTGGWHQLLADRIPEVHVNQHLVLHGTRVLMQMNL